MSNKITVVMALYKPNLKWLEEQIKSIDNQRNVNLEIIIWNDDPLNTIDYVFLLDKWIKKNKYKLYHSVKNMGSTAVFEKLTNLVETEYIAYCDQDDIWMLDKIKILLDIMEKEKKALICSDMMVINKENKIISETIGKIRKRQRFPRKNNNYVKDLMIKNFVTGCTIVAKTEFAKKCVPFPKIFIHDWWLGINAAIENELLIFRKPLIYYRIHEKNQTGILKGIENKKDYYDKQIITFIKRINLCRKMFNNINIDYFYRFGLARKNWFEQKSLKNFIKMIKFFNLDKEKILFEIIIGIMPNKLFDKIIYFITRRYTNE